MYIRRFAIFLALLTSGIAGGRSHADFLIAQDFNKTKSIYSFGYTAGPNASITSTAQVVSGFTNTQGVAVSGSNLYVTGNTTINSGQVLSYSMGPNGSGNIAATPNTGFGTSGVVSLTAAGRGISVSPDGSKVSVALINNLKAVNLDSASGVDVGPTLNMTAGNTNVYKSVQNTAGDFFALRQNGSGSTPYSIAKFDSAGTAQGTLSLKNANATNFAPLSSQFRDILFVGNNTFYLTNYASTAGGGGLYKFNLSGNVATLDSSFGTNGYKAIANAFGIAMDSSGSIFLSQYYSASGGSSTILQVNASTGVFSTFMANSSSYAFQYLATTTVPEPTTYAMALASIGMLGFARKWRSKMAANV